MAGRYYFSTKEMEFITCVVAVGKGNKGGLFALWWGDFFAGARIP